MWLILLLIIIFIASFLLYQYNSYTSMNKLRNLLEQQKWKEANIQTSSILLFTIARSQRGHVALPPAWNRVIDKFRRAIFKPIGLYGISGTIHHSLKLRTSYTIHVEDIDQFSCSILHEIDNLWLKSSKGHFGFSVQMEIYKSCLQEINPLTNFNTNDDREFIKYPENITYSPRECPDSIRLLIEKLQWSYLYSGHYFPSFRYIHEFEYNLQAPKGHLPFLFNYSGEDFFYDENCLRIWDMVRLWNRFKICKIS